MKDIDLNNNDNGRVDSDLEYIHDTSVKEEPIDIPNEVPQRIDRIITETNSEQTNLDGYINQKQDQINLMIGLSALVPLLALIILPSVAKKAIEPDLDQEQIFPLTEDE